MSRLWKAMLWIGGAFVVLAAIAVFADWIFVSGILLRTHDQMVLKAIKAESEILMAAQPAPTETYSDVPKSRWPRTIASLKPKLVIVFRDRGVEILISPFFDGGWGYFVPQGEQGPLRPGCSETGQGVYWCHPY